MDMQLQLQQKVFREEAYELLGELENALLELEETPDDSDLIGRVFRAMHTIKGSGAMAGFGDVSDFTHEVETAYDLVRDGRLQVTRELINLSLAARDRISEMLDASQTGEGGAVNETSEIVSGFKALMADVMPPENTGAEDSRPMDSQDCTDPRAGDAPTATYRIRFQPAEDLFSNGTNPLPLLMELGGLGECHIIANTKEIPSLADIRPDICYVFWDIILTTDRGRDAIEDVFIFVEDACRLSIQLVDQDDGEAAGPEYRKLGEILVERGDLSPGDVEKMLLGRKRIGELLTDAGIVSRDAVESALEEQKHIRKIRKDRMETANAASVRVDAEKLDALVDLVGELVTVQARLSRRAAVDNEGELALISEEVERLVSELRDNTMSIRMRPISTTFSKFKRLVRDLSEALGKEVILTTDGGETELDKTVLEQLNDPMMHIIRNCIDHGIESPGERTQAGKPALGTVHLSAAHVGAHVEIRIQDDGAGLNADAIRQSAMDKGLIASRTELSEKEIFNLIFMPGFSTARTVTGVSGRGVGMDVVKKRIESLRGSIDVQSGEGKGTTIILVLPLTLAIIEGFMVAVGDGYFVFPLAAVEECVKVPDAEMESVRRRNILNLRGEVAPYLNLRKYFGIEGEPPSAERIVVVESGGQRVGFGVDGVIGQHQTVIKSLGRFYRDIRGISGATILGDGNVGLILDVSQLMTETAN